MRKVRIKKGYRFRMAGRPSSEMVAIADPARIAFLPEKIPHIRPRLKVAEADKVEIGSVLFEDKQQPDIQFLSPAGGTVRRIRYGPRRVVQAIEIDRNIVDEPRRSFQKISEDQIERMPRDRIVQHILQGGLWWVFRALPFRNIPDPGTQPPAIILNLSSSEPFQPMPGVYLQGRSASVAYGIKILHKLTQGKVMVMTDGDLPDSGGYDQWLTHRVTGGYPADDPGVLLYHVKRRPEQNRAWFVQGQDLILLAQLLSRGQYPVERIYSVAGTNAATRRHVRSRLGVPLTSLADLDGVADDTRFLVGGILTGYAGDGQGFMGHYETALNLLPNGNRAEFLALFNPGHDKPSHSRAFLSKLNHGRLDYDCNLHGGRRACIACMHCTDVCPVDIMPHWAYKAIKAEEVEEYLGLGLLDCVACGLCSYVCPSKIELTRTFVDAKAAYAKETGGSAGDGVS